MESSNVVKVVVVGESSVGKSCLLERYVHDTFDEYREPTRGNAYQEKILLSHNKSQSVKLVLWDTAGQEIYKSLTKSYYKDADAVVMVYDMTNQKSFAALGYWLKEVKENSPSDCSWYIVGNKSDCIDREQVSAQEGKAFAIANKANFATVSAKENCGVKELFLNIAIQRFPQLRPEFDIEQEPQPIIDADVNLPIRHKDPSHKLTPKPRAREGCRC